HACVVCRPFSSWSWWSVNSRNRFCHADGWLTFTISTAVTLYSGQFVAQSEFSRSEEHTSELQSPYDLVCRLLLEKKNIKLRSSPVHHLSFFLLLTRPPPRSPLFPYTTSSDLTRASSAGPSAAGAGGR